MNITLVSLITTMISHSPAYVGNYMMMKSCHFQKFSSLLFYNQKYLYLKDTTFQHGLSGVIKHDSLINSSIVDDPTFNKINSTTFMDESFNENAIYFEPQNEKAVFTVINCFFSDIKFNEGLIHVKKASFYLTESTFVNCDGSSKTIWLDQSRCNTISHICCTNVTAKSDSSFVYGNGQQDDFFILLYSTIVGKSTDDINGKISIYAQYGLQYHRCLNLTNLKTEISIIQYQSPRHFSQRFITFDTIKDSNLIELSRSDVQNITCEMINAVQGISINNDKSLILINTDNEEIDFTLKSCAFVVSEHENKEKINLISTTSNLNKVTFMFIDCSFDKIIDITVDGKEIQTPNVIIAIGSEITELELPHYTKQGYCFGKPNKHLSKKGCNAGACFNESDCEDQIYFPSDAVKFTTMFHTEFYYPDTTPVFSETNYFSNSAYFTKSSVFSETSDFTKSSLFSETSDFTKSDSFTKSSDFTKSDQFAKTSDFTKSDPFAKTKEFTRSSFFTKTSDFTKSSVFTSSNKFSQSSQFSDSHVFRSSQIPIPKTLDNVTIIIENNDSKSHTLEIGIGVGVGAAAAIGAVIGFFIWKNKKNIGSFDENETIEVTEDNTNSIVTDNDLNKIMGEDDPFAEEFEN